MHIVHTRREFVSGASHLAIAAVCMPLAVRERWARVALGTVVADERRPYPLSRRPTMRECPHCGTRRSSCRPTPAASIWVHERFSWCRGRATRPGDVSIEVDDPSLVFCGNLVWNGMFPNYVDAAPSALTPSVKALRRPGATTYVPGHGGVAHEGDVARYVSMLDEVEAAARSARAKGISISEAAATFTLPKSLGEWIPFNKVFHERAFAAWYRDLPA